MESVKGLREIDWDRELTPDEREICHTQAALFAFCQKDYQYDAFDFITKFMKSDIAASIDTNGAEYSSMKPSEFIESLRGKLTALPLSERRSVEALHWVGYIYRYWAWLGTPSKEIINVVPVEDAYSVYYSFHTLDVKEALSMLVSQVAQ